MVPQRNFDEELPAYDEGWWASILADEENLIPRFSSRQNKVDEHSKVSLDWKHAQELYDQDQIVAMKVTGYNRGGLLVEGNGLQGFVPCSHLVELSPQLEEEDRERFFASYVERSLNLKVIECVPDEGRIVFSERAARAGEGRRSQLLSALQVNQRISGEVTNITDFGVFVDLGGVEGLIHISELSWGRVNHPGQILNLGQNVEVIVLDVAPERCRIALSLKRLFPNPWETAGSRYLVNQVVPAEITALVPFGAFARLEEGLEGLIHVSEIPLPPKSELKEFVTSGQKVQVRILQIDVERQRLGLSMRIDDSL